MLPRNSFARKIVSMRGYTEEQAVMEVAYFDGVSVEEAALRIRLAREQSARRSDAQRRRHWEARQQLRTAMRHVLCIARDRGEFIASRDLVGVALLMPYRRLDTARAFREACLPLEKSGLIAELRDEDDRFIGYVITEAGIKALSSDGPIP